MTCNDCLHGELCVSRTDTTFFNKTEYRDLDNVEKFCDDFKNKADFVEVVRCKDCKHYQGVDDDTYSSYCELHTEKVGYCDEAVYMKPTDFCSYGERK